FPRKVHEENRSAIVPHRRMVDESDFVGLRRKTDVTDPAVALIQDVAQRILNLITSVGAVDNGQLTIRPPVGPADILKKFPRRTAGESRARQRAAFNFKVRHVSAMKQKR